MTFINEKVFLYWREASAVSNLQNGLPY